MKIFQKIIEFVHNWPLLLGKGVTRGAKAIQTAKQPREVKVKITEEVATVKPTKWKPEPIPDYASSTKAMTSQFKENKKAIEKQKSLYGMTDTKAPNPLEPGIYFKLNQPGSIPESPYLHFLGYSRVDGMPLYVYYGDDIEYYTGIYNIEEIHNL